ncbi:hypothetical protein [Sanguibacter antarcticus]|uniref:hypothetical protein n=1 Tax=Sanguibacter antarcticus TaxID=372484 RepID=UPI000BF61C68|nr:hypothetical protein [Sanguibacter antarcticus]
MLRNVSVPTLTPFLPAPSVRTGTGVIVAPVYPAWWDELVVPDPVPPMFLAWATDDGLGDTIVGSCLRIYDASLPV